MKHLAATKNTVPVGLTGSVWNAAPITHLIVSSQQWKFSGYQLLASNHMVLAKGSDSKNNISDILCPR